MCGVDEVLYIFFFNTDLFQVYRPIGLAGPYPGGGGVERVGRPKLQT